MPPDQFSRLGSKKYFMIVMENKANFLSAVEQDLILKLVGGKHDLIWIRIFDLQILSG